MEIYKAFKEEGIYFFCGNYKELLFDLQTKMEAYDVKGTFIFIRYFESLPLLPKIKYVVDIGGDVIDHMFSSKKSNLYALTPCLAPKAEICYLQFIDKDNINGNTSYIDKYLDINIKETKQLNVGEMTPIMYDLSGNMLDLSLYDYIRVHHLKRFE